MNPDNRRFILVVDDESGIRMLIEAILRPGGYEVRMASTGAEALGICERSTPCLVISDIEMPGMNGFALAEQLRSLPESPPLLLMSGYSDRLEQRTRSELTPAQRILSKPFTPRQLIEAVSGILGVPATAASRT